MFNVITRREPQFAILMALKFCLIVSPDSNYKCICNLPPRSFDVRKPKRYDQCDFIIVVVEK